MTMGSDTDADDDDFFDGFPPAPRTPEERRARAEARQRRIDNALHWGGVARFVERREKTLCGLAFDPESRRWVGEAYQIFRPEGLLITSAPAGAMLVDWTQGNTRVFPIGPAPIPLDLFVILELRPETRPSYPTLDLGHRISLTVIDGATRSTIGPPMTLTVWGWSAR